MPPNCTCNSLRILRKLATAASKNNHTRILPNPCQYHLNRSRTLLPIHSSYSTCALRLEQRHSQGPMPADCTRRCTGSKVRTQAHALEIESSYSVSWYNLLNLVELSCLSGKAPHRPCWLMRQCCTVAAILATHFELISRFATLSTKKPSPFFRATYRRSAVSIHWMRMDSITRAFPFNSGLSNCSWPKPTRSPF